MRVRIKKAGALQNSFRLILRVLSALPPLDVECAAASFVARLNTESRLTIYERPKRSVARPSFSWLRSSREDAQIRIASAIACLQTAARYCSCFLFASLDEQSGSKAKVVFQERKLATRVEKQPASRK